MQAAQAIQANPGVLILDVREPAEYAVDHIGGALHVPRGVLEAKADLKYADRNQPIIVYCASGARSAFAADVLQVMGFTNVQSMLGGIIARQAQDLPVEN